MHSDLLNLTFQFSEEMLFWLLMVIQLVILVNMQVTLCNKLVDTLYVTH